MPPHESRRPAEPTPEGGLFPAEHRALRELYAGARQLASHWSALSDRLPGEPVEPLDEGSALARDLLRELAQRTAEHGLHGFPAAQGVGSQLAGLRNSVGDAFLERNQALRLAVLDVQHLRTLLAYLAELASTRDDEALAAFHRGWEERLLDIERRAREAAVACGRHPAAAITPAWDSAAGQAAHRAAHAIGTLGEWIDASGVGRAARRRTSRGTRPPGG
jgi:hypothetical protein